MGETPDIGLDQMLMVGAIDLRDPGKVSLQCDSKLKTFIEIGYFQDIYIIFYKQNSFSRYYKVKIILMMMMMMIKKIWLDYPSPTNVLARVKDKMKS